MKKRKRRLIRMVIALAVLALMFLFMRVANGKLVFLTGGFEKNQLLEVGEQKVYDYEANVLLSDIRSQYEDLFTNDIWNQTVAGENFADYAKEQTRTKLIRIACMNQLASERGVVLTREETANAQKAAAEYLSGLSDSQKTALGVTQDNMTQMYTAFAIAGRLYDDMTSAMQIEISAEQARVITIQYIAADTKEAIEQAKAKIDGGESFYAVALSMSDSENVQYESELKRGEMDSAFEEAAFALASGETSGIVEAGGRFYLIKCTSDNEKAKTEANRTTLLEEVKLEKFNETFEAYEASVFVHMNEKNLGTLSAKDAVRADADFEEIYTRYFG